VSDRKNLENGPAELPLKYLALKRQMDCTRWLCQVRIDSDGVFDQRGIRTRQSRMVTISGGEMKQFNAMVGPIAFFHFILGMSRPLERDHNGLRFGPWLRSGLAISPFSFMRWSDCLAWRCSSGKEMIVSDRPCVRVHQLRLFHVRVSIHRFGVPVVQRNHSKVIAAAKYG